MRMGEQYGLLWNQIDFDHRQLHLSRTKNGDPRTIPLNAVVVSALKDMQGKPEPSRFFPRCTPGMPSKVRAGGSRPRSTRPRSGVYLALQPPYLCQ
jgi:integrase